MRREKEQAYFHDDEAQPVTTFLQLLLFSFDAILQPANNTYLSSGTEEHDRSEQHLQDFRKKTCQHDLDII